MKTYTNGNYIFTKINLPWSDDEKNLLVNHYPKEGLYCDFRLPNRTHNAIRSMAYRMGLKCENPEKPADYDETYIVQDDSNFEDSLKDIGDELNDLDNFMECSSDMEAITRYITNSKDANVFKSVFDIIKPIADNIDIYNSTNNVVENPYCNDSKYRNIINNSDIYNSSIDANMIDEYCNSVDTIYNHGCSMHDYNDFKTICNTIHSIILNIVKA